MLTVELTFNSIMQQAFDGFLSVIKSLNPKVTNEELAYFKAGFSFQEFESHSFVAQAGKKNPYLRFITSGLVRGYYIDLCGNDITTTFIKENEWITNYPSLLSDKPSRYSFQCLEPTQLVSVPYKHILDGYDQFTGFERNGRLIAETVLKMQQIRIESFQFDSAEQRYIDFVKTNPSLFNRISLTHLSSYLGIERPSLSRIRRKIAGL